MKIRVFDTPDEAGVYVAAIAEQVVSGCPQSVLGLATGSTPIPFYRALVRLVQCGLNVHEVTTVNLDEYVGLPPDHPQSYRYFMEHHLFRHIPIDVDKIHIPYGTAADLDAECARYDQVVADYPADLQILGIGLNGHIGFNEPSAFLDTKTHVVELTKKTILHNSDAFGDPALVPTHAITMGLQGILQARQIVMMAFGEEKSQVVAQALQGEVRTDLPASILHLHHDVTWVLDRAAARMLPLHLGDTEA